MKHQREIARKCAVLFSVYFLIALMIPAAKADTVSCEINQQGYIDLNFADHQPTTQTIGASQQKIYKLNYRKFGAFDPHWSLLIYNEKKSQPESPNDPNEKPDTIFRMAGGFTFEYLDSQPIVIIHCVVRNAMTEGKTK